MIISSIDIYIYIYFSLSFSPVRVDGSEMSRSLLPWPRSCYLLQTHREIATQIMIYT